MGRLGAGYGSEYHLLRYLATQRRVLNEAVAKATGLPAGSITWRRFPRTPTGHREFRRLDFLQGTRDEYVLPDWAEFWPRTGTPHTWDLVGRSGRTWLLVEAKAHAQEMVGSGTGAKGDGLAKIEKRLNSLKSEMGVYYRFVWTKLYYQHTNRLAAVWFLGKRGVSARLAEIYFTGDVFPDGALCPKSDAEWKRLIEARRLTLGLPKKHALSKVEHHIFLPALRT